MTKSAAKKRTYHHGNLRAALLEAGLMLLEKRGLDQLSLRKVAAVAGVSHAAPAHHFPALEDLLTALAAIGFERFDAAMRSERDAAAKSPQEQLQAAAMGYAKFATQNPGLFRLMFSSALLDASDPVMRHHASAAFSQLGAISAPVAAFLGLDAEAEKAEIQKLVWSVAHGYAHLYIEGQMRLFNPECKPGEQALNPPNLGKYLFRSA
jgi:AcrR family transcriptional regulator